MNTTPTDLPPPEGDPAAEYVLGVLDAPARREVEARAERDAVFARDLAVWEERFMPLLADIEPVAVPARVWEHLRAMVGGGTTASATRGGESAGWWESLAVWRAFAGLATAAALACAIALVVLPHGTLPEPGAAMVSTLAHDDGSAGFVALIEPSRGQLTLTPVAAATSGGRVPELWLIPKDQAPRSLGIVDVTHSMVVRIPEAMLAEVGTEAVFAVTLEPPGGAPEGKPTGPVVAKGGVAVL